MTVRELIAELEKIEDKNQAVCMPYKVPYAPVEIDSIIPMTKSPCYHISDSNGRGYSYKKYLLFD